MIAMDCRPYPTDISDGQIGELVASSAYEE